VARRHAGQRRGACGWYAIPHTYGTCSTGPMLTAALSRLSTPHRRSCPVGQGVLEPRPCEPRVHLRRTRHIVRLHTAASRSVRARRAICARRVRRGRAQGRSPLHYVATAGYVRRVGRLPDFVGGPVFAGAWLENGDAFDSWRRAAWRSNGGAGLVMDTLVGPVVVAGSCSFDGRWRTYLAVGRTVR
jgi:hypothetical protein